MEIKTKILGTNWRPVLIAALISVMRDEIMAETIKNQKDISLKNAWVLNYWTKTANLMSMDLIMKIR